MILKQINVYWISYRSSLCTTAARSSTIHAIVVSRETLCERRPGSCTSTSCPTFICTKLHSTIHISWCHYSTAKTRLDRLQE